MAEVERGLIGVIIGEGRLFLIRAHEIIHGGEAFGGGKIVRHRVLIVETVLALLLKIGDGGEDGSVPLGGVDPAGREGTAIAQVFHIEKNVLPNIPRRDEKAMNRFRQTTFFDRPRRCHHGLRDDLTAINTASGEVKAFPFDISMIQGSRGGPQLEDPHDTVDGRDGGRLAFVAPIHRIRRIDRSHRGQFSPHSPREGPLKPSDKTV